MDLDADTAPGDMVKYVYLGPRLREAPSGGQQVLVDTLFFTPCHLDSIDHLHTPLHDVTARKEYHAVGVKWPHAVLVNESAKIAKAGLGLCISIAATQTSSGGKRR